MANNETVKIKMKYDIGKYRKGDTFEAIPHRGEYYIVNYSLIHNSNCEIIPSTDLIPFDWSKWESGQYEAIYDSNVVAELVKFKGSGAYAGVLQGEVCSFWAHTLQLRLKAVEMYAVVTTTQGMRNTLEEIKRVVEREGTNPIFYAKLTYAPGSDPGKDAPTHCEIVK